MFNIINIPRLSSDEKQRLKQENLERSEQHRLQRDCFWTWPIGHVYRTGSIEKTIQDEPVQVIIQVCACCSHRRNFVMDRTGNLRLDLAPFVPNMNLALK